MQERMMTSTIILAIASILSAADDEGFEPLFNGKDLTGWVPEGKCTFVVKGDEIYCPGRGNYPTWLRSEEVFENFELRFQMRMFRYGEGGIFISAPLHGRCSNVGFEIQLSDEIRNRKPVDISTGGIFGAVAPMKQAAKPLGEWNDLHVVFDWPTLKVTVNGVLVQDLNVEENPELRHRLRSGYLGLQDRGKPYWLKNLRVKRLPSKDTMKTLFDGSNLDQWEVLRGGGSATFTVDGDEIVAANGNGYLMTKDQYEDLDFFAYVRTDPFANGGVFVRWKSLVPQDRGYEIQIEDIADSNNPTGSIYDWARANSVLPFQPGEWYPLQIHIRGKTCVVRVNGTTVAQADDLEIVRAGPVGLQMHSAGKEIRFKSIRIRRLEPATRPSS